MEPSSDRTPNEKQPTDEQIHFFIKEMMKSCIEICFAFNPRAESIPKGTDFDEFSSTLCNALSISYKKLKDLLREAFGDNYINKLDGGRTYWSFDRKKNTDTETDLDHIKRFEVLLDTNKSQFVYSPSKDNSETQSFELKIPNSTDYCFGSIKGRPCKEKPLRGSTYCLNHSPLDINSDYIYCKYNYNKSDKKCYTPVLKGGDPYCPVHGGRDIHRDHGHRDNGYRESHRDNSYREGPRDPRSNGNGSGREKNKDGRDTRRREYSSSSNSSSGSIRDLKGTSGSLKSIIKDINKISQRKSFSLADLPVKHHYDPTQPIQPPQPPPLESLQPPQNEYYQPPDISSQHSTPISNLHTLQVQELSTSPIYSPNNNNNLNNNMNNSTNNNNNLNGNINTNNVYPNNNYSSVPPSIFHANEYGGANYIETGGNYYNNNNRPHPYRPPIYQNQYQRPNSIPGEDDIFWGIELLKDTDEFKNLDNKKKHFIIDEYDPIFMQKLVRLGIKSSYIQLKMSKYKE